MNIESLFASESDKVIVTLDGFDENRIIALKPIVERFIKSYKEKDTSINDGEWLGHVLKKELPELSEEDAMHMGQECIEEINYFNNNLQDLSRSIENGNSKESWFANKVQEASVGMSINDFGNYLNNIDIAINHANTQMSDAITTQEGYISMCNNLDGFIAEQYHAATFNMDAILKKSDLRAIARIPEPSAPYLKNSVDVVIKDKLGTGSIKARYQAKYGADGKSTIKLFSKGDYRGQQKLVPAEQSDVIANSKDIIEFDGIKSKPLNKEQAKAMQYDTQKSKIVPSQNWNHFSTKELTLNIGKQAGIAGIQAAAITTGFDLTYRAMLGQEFNADETIEIALKTGADSGIKAATTGALKVGIEKGIISIIPKGTPIGILTNVVCVGIENVKIMSKVAIGELTMTEALDHMGRTSTAMVYGLSWGATGVAIGATALSWIPLIGPIVGGCVGGIVGYMAGSKFGETIYNGAKKLVNGAKKVLSNIGSGLKSAARGVVNFLFG